MASEPIAGITVIQLLGEIGQRVQMLLELALRHMELGSAGVPPATFGVLAGRFFAHRFIRRDAG
ncbi:MAG: hypothetical protein WBW41_05025 [Verrucomicrobiia bacterium]